MHFYTSNFAKQNLGFVKKKSKLKKKATKFDIKIKRK